MEMSKPYCRQTNPVNNGNDNNIIIDFHKCGCMRSHMNYFRLFVILMFCYYIPSKMLNYYPPLQCNLKNQQVNELLFTPDGYVEISIKKSNT
jgi:hypothetical protein